MDAKISQTRPRLREWRICAWNSNLRKNSRQDSERRILKNWSISSICAKFSVTQEQVRRTFDRVYQHARLQKARTRKAEGRERRRLKSKHIGWLNAKFQGVRAQALKLGMIRVWLIEEFPELEGIWLSTISKCLRSDLRLSYKRLE